MSSPALPEETLPALSEGQRLLYTFTAPSRTMADLRRNAGWWVPWLLVSVASIAFCFALEKRIGWEQVLETQLQSNPKTAAQFERMTPEQRHSAMKTQTAVASAIGYAAPLTTLFALVVIASILLGTFNFGFGTKLHFGELMSVSAYSLLPSILNTLLMILVLFLVEPENFDVNNPVATSIGYFVPQTLPFLKKMLSAFDVFTFWQVFLLAIGVSQLSRLKVKTGVAFAAIFSLFFLLKLAGAALGSM